MKKAKLCVKLVENYGTKCAVDYWALDRSPSGVMCDQKLVKFDSTKAHYNWGGHYIEVDVIVENPLQKLIVLPSNIPGGPIVWVHHTHFVEEEIDNAKLWKDIFELSKTIPDEDWAQLQAAITKERNAVKGITCERCNGGMEYHTCERSPEDPYPESYKK